MNLRVFIQNEAGSNQKHHHDEKTFEWKSVMDISRHYPFPYGFVVGTTADDGGNVDCFVITEEPLKTGQLIECQIAGLMEQFEDGQEDHNVLTTLPGTSVEIGPKVKEGLTEFVYAVFEQIEGTSIKVGQFLGVEDAEAYVAARSDPR